MGDEIHFQFGKYVLLELVGRGSTAAVYRAVRSGAMGFRKEVAIKKVLSTVVDRERVLKRLINEARVSGYLHHRNLVEVYEFDRVDEAYYLALEYVSGYSLHDILGRVRTQGALPAGVIGGLLVQICDGLAYAHGAVDEKGQPMNLVHRDIKPGNVMLSSDGVVKITDFGVAKATTNLFHTRAENITRGTPIYMSPEQVRGLRLDARSDIFALGSLTVEMVTGQVLFQDTHLYRVLSKVDRAEVERPLHVVEEAVPALAPILRRALQRDPRARFPSAAAMAREVRGALSPVHGPVELAGWLREWMSAEVAGGEEPLSLDRLGDEEADPSGPMAVLALEVPRDEDIEAERAEPEAPPPTGDAPKLSPIAGSPPAEPTPEVAPPPPAPAPPPPAAPAPPRRAAAPTAGDGTKAPPQGADTDGESPAYLTGGETTLAPPGSRPADGLATLFPDPGGADGAPGYLVEDPKPAGRRLEDVSLSELKLADLVGDIHADDTGEEVTTLEEGVDPGDPDEAATAVDFPVPPLPEQPGGADPSGDGPADDLDEDDDSPTLDEEEPLEREEALDLPVAMAAVQPGAFWMGSGEVEVGRDADEELHEVRIGRPFLLGRVPVTEGQWARVMGDPVTPDARDLPVAGVTWFDAVDFCNRLSEREGLQPAYQIDGDVAEWDPSADGYRLPTEAEWEYAARAGEYSRFAGSDHADAVAWHRGNALELLQPVARKSPNGLGLYDMSGNVCEWVWDRYGPYPVAEETRDPTGPADGEFRVQRGGSVYSPAADVRVARRHIDGRPDESRPQVGFRLARSLP